MSSSENVHSFVLPVAAFFADFVAVQAAALDQLTAGFVGPEFWNELGHQFWKELECNALSAGQVHSADCRTKELARDPRFSEPRTFECWDDGCSLCSGIADILDGSLISRGYEKVLSDGSRIHVDAHDRVHDIQSVEQRRIEAPALS